MSITSEWVAIDVLHEGGGRQYKTDLGIALPATINDIDQQLEICLRIKHNNSISANKQINCLEKIVPNLISERFIKNLNQPESCYYGSWQELDAC